MCPTCARVYPPDERFCPRCAVPLIYPAAAGGGEHPPGSARERDARKIKPQYSEGELVRAVGARNQAEAEFIQGLLLEEGIPSMLRRARGFDVPDFLAAGPRDVLVPLSAAHAAREVLMQSDVLSSEEAESLRVNPWRLLAWLLAALVLLALLLWIAGAGI